MKKKYIIGIIAALVIVVDISVALYPTVANYFNSFSQSRAVVQYADDVALLGEDGSAAMLAAAREYNQALLQKAERFQFTEAENAEYRELLRTERGIMGMLVIDKINTKLPIYHGTDEGVLQVGLGHMQGTSLPVGGTGTHAFITGHRGLPSSVLLTDLDKLAEGDTFVLYTAGETLSYQVDQIQTVEPHEVESLNIDPEADYCTLVTCTPYGINTHRLLVRGHRVENAAENEWNAIFAGARMLDKLLVVLAVLALISPILLIVIVIRCRKIRKGNGR